jgi:hypothetical protein
MNNPHQLNYTQQLEHRLESIKFDIKAIEQFIKDQGLYDKFTNNTSSMTSDVAIMNIHNINIACDLKNDRSLSWAIFYK